MLAYFADSPREDQRGTTAQADSGSLRNKSDREMQYLSVFAEHLFRFGSLSVTPGVRLEHIWQHVEEQQNIDKLSAGTPLAKADEFDFVPLFGVGASYALAPWVSLYSNVSQAYRPKVFTQAVPTGGTTVINNDLEEGKSWSLDVGLRGEPVPGVAWDASYFFMRFQDQIGTSGSTIDNVGNARYQGAELALEADLTSAYDALQDTDVRSQVGSVTPYLSLMVLDATFTKGPQQGNTPQYAPQYLFRTGVEYAWEDRVKAALASTFVGGHFADDANTGAFTVPSYKVWDFTGEVALWPPYVTLVGGINNLFDARYHARVRGDGIDPAPERNLYGGVRVGIEF